MKMQPKCKFIKAERNKRSKSNKIMHWKIVRISEASSNQIELCQCSFSFIVKDVAVWILFIFLSRGSFLIPFTLPEKEEHEEKSSMCSASPTRLC